MRPHLRHTSRLTVGSDGTQPGQLVLINFPVLPGTDTESSSFLAANREPPFGAACRRAVRQGLRFMLRGRVLCGSVPSARSFVPDYDPRQSGYLLLDVRMPQMTRTAVAARLDRLRYRRERGQQDFEHAWSIIQSAVSSARFAPGTRTDLKPSAGAGTIHHLKRCERQGSSPRCSRAAAHRPERSGPQRRNAR
jgi:hypothetical protein